MPEKSPETFKSSQEKLSSKEEKPLELGGEESPTAEKIRALKKMKELVEKEWLAKALFAECIGEINQTTGETRMEVARGELKINPQEIAEDIELENFKNIKRDKLINPETEKVTNINRIEFDLELTYPNKEKETLRFVSLEVPEEYRDLTKCHAYKELIKNTQGEKWAPKLNEEFDQRFITWQKEMIREKDNSQRIRTVISLENPKRPTDTDIKRETLKRGMRTMTIEENIILAEMLKRNGFSTKAWTPEKCEEWGQENKERVEEFLGIKDLWASKDEVKHIYDFSFYTGQDGQKGGFVRGGGWGDGSYAGIFALGLHHVLSSAYIGVGFRCAR